MINQEKYYNEWSGHPIKHLKTIISNCDIKQKKVIWLAGDSTLDNKAWILQSTSTNDTDKFAAAINGYQNVFLSSKKLCSTTMLKDVCFCINYLIRDDRDWICINGAVEASTLIQRSGDLLKHDLLIRDNMNSKDVLIVSVGGNDIALHPTPETMRAMLTLLSSDHISTDRHSEELETIVDIFGHQLYRYVQRLTEKHVPEVIIVCLPYLPDLNAAIDSWASTVLAAIHYDTHPQRLHNLLEIVCEKVKPIFQSASNSNSHFKHSKLHLLPMFRFMDGTRSDLYEKRVEPSIKGGRIMAQKFLEIIKDSIMK